MKHQSDIAQPRFHYVESTTNSNRHIPSMLLIYFIIACVLFARASLADTMTKSPSLRLQFIQDDQVVSIRSERQSDEDLSVLLRARPFKIRIPRINNWAAQTPGLPGCPPTDGLLITVGIDRDIYSRLKIGERTGYSGFFGCAKTISVGPERPVTTLVVSVPEDYPSNFFENQRYETVSAISNTLLVKNIIILGKHSTRNVLQSGETFYTVFHVDKNGDDVVQRNEIEKITIELSN